MRPLPNVRSAAALCSGLARVFRYRGLMVVALWQAPVGPAISRDGSVAFLFGAGSDEFADVSCEGNLLDARRVRYRMAGVEADHSLDRRIRVNATAGFLDADLDGYGGPFAAGQLRVDSKSLGLGGGFYSMPHMDEYAGDRQTLPSFYLRVGSAENIHVRADVLPPFTLGMHQVVRLGLGLNATRRDRASGFLGLAGIGHDQAAGGVAFDLDIPVSHGAGFTLRSHFGDGRRYDLAGATMGARIVFD
jgi:hypothetical protein